MILTKSTNFIFIEKLSQKIPVKKKSSKTNY